MKTAKKLETRKALLFAPILLIPLLALAFYATGGGKGTVQDKIVSKGISTELPDASFKHEKEKDKLGLYEQAKADSSRSEDAVMNAIERLGFRSDEEVQTDKINQKLEELNREISRPSPKPTGSSSISTSPKGMQNDVDRLEMLMKSMQQGKEKDPEMEQLNTALQSIMDIQHPERVREKYLNQLTERPDSLFRAIPAIIVDNQRVVQGATIRLKLTDSVRLNGQFIPKGQFVFGLCNIANQRLLLDVKTIRLGNRIVPVDLSVYSLDGIRGIAAPEALLTDAINGGSDDAVRNIQLLGLDQSMGAQIAGAGIQATKSLFSRKVKRIKVKLKSGYQVLLRNNQERTR